MLSLSRLIVAATLALSALGLSACASFDPFHAPAPLEQSVLDEKALVLALETFDTVLTSVDILTDAGYIQPGSTRARQIADAIDRAKGWMQAASAAQRAGSTASYLEALEQARRAIASVKSSLQ